VVQVDYQLDERALHAFLPPVVLLAGDGHEEVEQVDDQLDDSPLDDPGGKGQQDQRAVQDPGDDPGEEGQLVLCVRGSGQAAHQEELGDTCDVQAVLCVSYVQAVQGPRDDPGGKSQQDQLAVRDPGEEDQLVLCVRGGGQPAYQEVHGRGDGQTVMRVSNGQAVLHVNDSEVVMRVGDDQAVQCVGDIQAVQGPGDDPGEGQQDRLAVQDPGDDPGEEDQLVLYVIEGGHVAHQKVHDRGDGQAVMRVGDVQAVLGPGDDPGEEGQQDQLCGAGEYDWVPVCKSCVVEGHIVILLAVNVEQPHAVEVLALENAAGMKRREDQAKRGHKEDDLKSVMGKAPMIRKGNRHKCKERRRGGKQEKKRRIQTERRDKQKRKRRVQDRMRDKQEMKQKRRRVWVMWTNKQERKRIRGKEAAVPSRGRAISEKRQM
jgi:hypothetical protein